MVKTIRYAIRSLLVHKMRAALSVLGIVCGVMAVLSMLAIGEGAKQEALSQIEQLGTRNIYIKAISLTDEQKIKARERLSRGLHLNDVRNIKHGSVDIDEIAYLKEIRASLIGESRDVTPQIVASSSNYAHVQKLVISQGRFIADQDSRRRNLVCVLGDSVAKSLGSDGKPGRSIRIEDMVFKIVGVLKRYDQKSGKSSVISIRNYNEMVFLPWGTASGTEQSVITGTNSSSDELTEIIVTASNIKKIQSAVELLKRILETTHGGVMDYQIIVPQELLRQSMKTRRTFNIVLGTIAGISLLVGGIGIMNIMLATVSERTREIGIRRAVGATQMNIITQFLVECVLLTLSGGIIGIVAGVGSVWLISTMAEWRTAITLWSLLLPFTMSACAGIFFGLYPAYVAARMDPISALRHE